MNFKRPKGFRLNDYKFVLGISALLFIFTLSSLIGEQSPPSPIVANVPHSGIPFTTITPVIKEQQSRSKRELLLEKLFRQTSIIGNLNIPVKTTVTLVSAFFDLSRIGQQTKHSPDFYLEAGRDGVLSLDSPVVFFTDSPQHVISATKKAKRPLTAPMYIVNVSLHDFDVVQEHLKRTSDLVPKDNEAVGFGYSGLLFIIYHAKPEMMSLAYQLNPFKTEKFLWMDVGCVRNWAGIEAADYRGKPFPRPDREYLLGRDGRILMQGVAGTQGPCPKEIRWVDPENVDSVKDPTDKLSDPLDARIQPNNWWIAGALWGGRGEDLIPYEMLYRKHLRRYLERDLNQYALIDQYIMGALACHTNKVEVVRPPLFCCVDRTNRKCLWLFR